MQADFDPKMTLISYFSMEIGLAETIPTYSGGLGMLAGDTIRSAADLKVPVVAMSILHRKGYFHQKLDESGWQTEEPENWIVDDYLKELPNRVSVSIEGRTVYLKAWEYAVVGISGHEVPVYFLDSDLQENSEWDRQLTSQLYGGDSYFRLCQEVILGIGGIRMLKDLGYENIERFHMNEGHASFLTLELLTEEQSLRGGDSITTEDIENVRKKCVFTTHTPVPAGHDKFPFDIVKQVIGDHPGFKHEKVFCCDSMLNMTYLALNLSHYVNGVAKKHGEVSQHMFASYTIDSITNGVHVSTWASKPFQELYDKYIPGWREDNFSLRYALKIPKDELWSAHMVSKEELIKYVNRECNGGFDLDCLTIGFARRAASYKRADLLFHDIERLRNISKDVGEIQIVYAGKAHPHDNNGKELIKRIFQAKQSLAPDIKIAYLPNYDMALGKLLTSGVDIWLNTPNPPMEASGTSGMKATLNGIPSFSVLDGWWIEGCIENITGWAIGTEPVVGADANNSAVDAESLYDKLANKIIPSFYNNRDYFISIMLHSVALNGSFFNTQRMMQQYVLKAYF